MANVAIHKFRFPKSLLSFRQEVISYSETANELIEKVNESSHALILCALASKEDLLQIISFYQKKKTALKEIPHTIVLVDFQEGGNLLAAAKRLTLERVYQGEKYLAQEEEFLTDMIDAIKKSYGRYASHQTYEDLFSKNKPVILKNNTKRRLYPVEEVSQVSLPEKSPLELMTEVPQTSFKIFEGEKLIESQLVDYFDREIYLRTKELPEDNNLILEFKVSYQGDKKGLRLKTEVINIEEDEGEYQLTLKIESHLKEFELMLKIFQKREQNIAQFLKKVKGY